MNFSSILPVLPEPLDDCVVNTVFDENNVLGEMGWGLGNVNEALMSESPNYLHCVSCNKYKVPETQDEIFLSQSQGINGNYYFCEQCCMIHDMKLQINELTNQIHELNIRVSTLRNIQSSEREIDNTMLTHVVAENASIQFQDEERDDLASCDLFDTSENDSDSTSVNNNVRLVDTEIRELTLNNVTDDISPTSQYLLTEHRHQSDIVSNSAATEPPGATQSNKVYITEDDKRVKYIFTGDKCISRVHVTNQINTRTCCKVAYRKPNLKQTSNTVDYLLKSRLKNVAKVILQIGVHHIKEGGSESVKHDLKELINMIHKRGKDVIVSGPFPTPNISSECFSRMVCINNWLVDSHSELDFHFIDNFDSFWERSALFVEGRDVLNDFGSMVLSNNIRSSILL